MCISSAGGIKRIGMVLGDKRKDKRDEHQRRHGDFAGRRAGERDRSALYQPQHMPSNKDKLPPAGERANSNSQGVTRIGQRCQQPYISSEAPSKG